MAFIRPSFILENTGFIFERNFSGDPSRDKWGRHTRRANVIIPTAEEAEELADLGLDVKQTRPREGEEEGFVPRYYVSVVVNYDSAVAAERPPMVYLVSSLDGTMQLLDKETISRLDNVYVLNVDVNCEVATLQQFDRKVAYVKTMYVTHEVEEDPFASKYAQADTEIDPDVE